MSVASGPQRGLFIGCLGIGLGCMVLLDLYFAPAAFAVGDDGTPRDGGSSSSFLPSFSSSSSGGGPSSASSVKVLIPAQARVPTIVARFDTAEKEPTDQSAIRALATAMIEDHDARIVLEGHSDTQGGQDYNQEISLARAEWVKSRLVALGVSGARIETVGLGSTRPLHNRNDAQAQNRRVEVRWLTGPSDPAPPSRRPDPTPAATTATTRPTPKASASASAMPVVTSASAPPATSASTPVPPSTGSSDLAPRHDTTPTPTPTPTPSTSSSSPSPPESNAPRDGVEPTGR